MDREDPTGRLKTRQHQGREGSNPPCSATSQYNLYGDHRTGPDGPPSCGLARHCDLHWPVRPGLVATRAKRLRRS